MTKLAFAVKSALPQELEIRIRGADVLLLEPHASSDEEAPIPDLGDLFARSARAGLFGGATAPPWAAVAEVLQSEAALPERRASWLLRLGGIDPGAFRVMWNVLRARDLEEASMITGAPPGAAGAQAPRLDAAALAYPGAHGRLPFAIDVEPPLHGSKDRAVQLVFQRAPPEAVVDQVLDALSLWTQLLLLGGYPEDGGDPQESGVFPDTPFQLDEVTIEQAFPELFAADEAAFNAVVNHAAAVHRAGHAISAVSIR